MDKNDNRNDIKSEEPPTPIAQALEEGFQDTIEGLDEDHPMSRAETIRQLLESAEREARYMRTETSHVGMMETRIRRLRGDLRAVGNELDRLEAHYEDSRATWLEAVSVRVLKWMR